MADKSKKPPDTAYVTFICHVNYNSVSNLLSGVKQLMAHGAKTIHIHISSGGGQLIPGFGCYNELKSLPVDIVTHNIGSINSIANVIYLAGSRRLSSATGTFLFHGTSWTFSQGAEVERPKLSEIVTSLEADEQKIKDIFLAETNISDSDLQALINQGATRDAQYAKSVDIVHEIEEPKVPHGAPLFTIT